VRIPLDYYRILGLPIQATAEQLKQAHRDRTLQLPRREYSEIAIESRKSLIDEAYGLLSHADKRQTYDAQFLARPYAIEADSPTKSLPEMSPDVGEATLRALAAEDAATLSPEPYTPTIEIDESQFVGALLILLELGEYELAIRLGRPFVTNGTANLDNGRFGDPRRVREDIVLTLALACLELGREQWQQNQYENAAESLETGQELLLQENVFPGIRAELRSDLYKLRPYRILELVARPLDQTAARRQGIKLLKAMLHDRGGIDGAEDDLSGLSTDDFLRFIQQLRGYLTAGEQQEIFEAEARRPSAVATYLAVYALLARGFAFHQPSLVRRAKQLLQRIGTRQDVHLEQAVCALLLGQAEEAGRFLELSQEYEPLAFIREHSQSAPDLLPGLCLYAERWLREEVFTHFRDLANQQTALKDYFANPQVQAYLEAMPIAAPTTAPISPPPAASTAPFSTIAAPPESPSPAMAGVPPVARRSPLEPSSLWHPPDAPPSETSMAAEGGLSIAERVSQLSPEGHLQPSGEDFPPPGSEQNGHRPSAAVAPPPATPVRRSRSPRWDRVVLLAVSGIIAVGTVSILAIQVLGWIGSALSGPKLQRPALDLGINAPPVPIPTPPSPEAQINVDDIAARAINDWLAAKSAALSQDHNVGALETALVDPALTEWRNQVSVADQASWYYEYEHNVEVLNVEPNDPGADALTVTAQVQEVADYYELGVRNLSKSYNADLTMQYELVRQDGEWFVKNMTEIE